MSNPCACGSRLARFALYDARRIFVTFVCHRCIARKKAEFRPEIFTDPNYETSEDVEGEFFEPEDLR